MAYKNQQKLSHLKNVFSNVKNNTDFNTQSIALEGWRRGLELNFYRDSNTKVKYSLNNKIKTFHFLSSKEDSVNSNKSINKTKRLLSANNVPVPKGKTFEADIDNEKLISYSNEIGFPIVLKTIKSNRNLFVNIQSTEELNEVLTKNEKRLRSRELMIEKFIDGEEIHLFIIECQVVSAIQKKPVKVMGNGKDSIKKLVKKLNEEQKLHLHLNTKIIKINKRFKNVLSKQNYKVNSIPEKNELIYLHDQKNISNNRDSIDVTNQMTKEIINNAIKAGKSITNAPYYEVKMIADFKKNNGTILTVNAKPDIADYLFPTEGQSKDIPKKIIDYYFPATKNQEKSNLYFNFEKIIDLLNNLSAENIKVTNCPTNQLFAKLYLVSGRVQKVGYRKWINKKAQRHKLHGYTRNLENGKVEVLVAGEKDTVNNFKRICLKGPKRSKVKSIMEIVWKEPVEIGFGIKPTRTISKLV